MADREELPKEITFSSNVDKENIDHFDVGMGGSNEKNLEV